MAFTWSITIVKHSGAPGFTYVPKVLKDVAVGDEIIWTNETDQPHWPGAPGNTKYFMANQIAPHSPSTTFIPTAVGTLTYKDSLTSGDPGGSIVVS